MTPEEFKRAEDLFHRARELSAVQRKQFLDHACPDDATVRAEVEALLRRADFGAQSTELKDGIELALAHAVVADGPTETNTSKQETPRAAGTRIGQYSIVRELGHGGFGIVYEAEQERPRRNVALKVVRPGLASVETLRRFELEAQVLARLQHPGIAQVYEVGTTDIGGGPQPFFAMELVQGRTLSDYADNEKLTARQRLELMGRVCDAVQHAHQKGVIHRDLKPGNILVDESGQPKILDFGVARVTDCDVRLTTIRTDLGQLIGTLPYMSPEQVSADPNDLDTRSDVYALGVILYELLAGRPPYDIYRKLIHEAVRVIREVDPTPLSSVSKIFRGDVEIIVAKALEKDKARRYQAASALAADIRRYLSDEPIAARPPSAIYQLRKFSKRNKPLVGGVLTVFVVLLAGVITSTRLYLRAEAQRLRAVEAEQQQSRERQQAETEREKADSVRRFLEKDLLSSVDPTSGLGIDVKVRDVLDRAVPQIERSFRSQPELTVSLKATIGDMYRALGLYPTAEEILASASAIGQEKLGNEHPETLRALLLLVRVKMSQGNLNLSSEVDRLRQTLIRVRGPDNLESLDALDLATGVEMLRGRYDEAERRCRLALEERRRVQGPKHPDTYTEMANLGTVLLWAGKPADAVPLLREAVTQHKATYGTDHPITLGEMGVLGQALMDYGLVSDAITILQDLANVQKRILGPKHLMRGVSLDSLGKALMMNGHYDAAQPILKKAYLIIKKSYGKNHFSTIGSQISLIQCQAETGKLDRAEKSLNELFDSTKGPLRPGSLLRPSALVILARIHLKTGKIEDAVGEAKKALELFRERSTIGPRGISEAQLVYAQMLAAAGQFEQAEQNYLEGLHELRAKKFEGSPSIQKAIAELVQLYHKWGKPDKASEYEKQILTSQPSTATHPAASQPTD
ncbi:hypothetical protein B7486_13405 [cyanobacterium TDX16]|nr:hypothetical protein B7486_13405 [cyanobacterium TDX16]